MSSYRNYTNNTSALAKNLEKLSSGYKINRAGDDAAGLAISEKMRAQITGLEVAQKNAKDGISLVQTAEGALTEVHSMLNRMYELAEQSANGTYQDDVDREQLQKEVDQLRTEINRIADSSNFNGIKLLDGSLSNAAKATTINIDGIASTKSLGRAGVYEMKEELGTDTIIGALQVDDTFTFTVSMSDGSSKNIDFTLTTMENGNYQFKTADGTGYPVSGVDSDSGDDELVAALGEALEGGIQSELLKTDLADDFSITMADSKVKLTALENGTATPRVTAFDMRYTKNKEVQTATSLGVTETQALDDGREISADAITEYDGTNYEDAVFTINGKKFVLLTNTMDGDTKGANDEYLRAVAGLGDDVTILVGGIGGLKKADPGTAPTQGEDANGNFNQNCKAIEKATGLTVTDAINEVDSSGTAAATGVAPGEGIRLSIGNNTVDKSLVLQIGDTAEDFNQLKVSVNDCHADAIGIGAIDISSQTGAADAMAKIKNAINYVSDVRGTLGATQNRLDHTINNLSVMQENIQDAESTIRDVDVAKEMMEYTKNNILVQSAQAMLAQANQLPQGVLQLLQ